MRCGYRFLAEKLGASAEMTSATQIIARASWSEANDQRCSSAVFSIAAQAILDLSMRHLLFAIALFISLATPVQAHKHNPKKSPPVAIAASRFVVMGADGQSVARVITSAIVCPTIVIDATRQPMQLRARADTLPLRPTRSEPADSKPSAFPVQTCDAVLPKGTKTASVEGTMLPVPKPIIERIVVIGDTGCRLKSAPKKADGAWQACGDPAAYPFGKIAAAAAAWKPDLIVHVGDYHYRENKCPDDQPQCQSSPWGYGWDAWDADFFGPGAPLLQVAPLAATRGNHENCNRAGQGWWRLIDPRPLEAGRDCLDASNDATGDFSEPYAIPLGMDTQLIILDLAKEAKGPITAIDPEFARFQDVYRKYETLAARTPYNIAANHHPILAFAAKDGAALGDPVRLMPGNEAIQSAFSSINPWIIPDHVQLLLSGHVHVWEQLSFKSQHPSQFVAGFSGTFEDVVKLPEKLDEYAMPAPGAEVASFSSWVFGFGWMSMERTGPQNWNVTVWDVNSKAVNHCTITGKDSKCDLAQVK